MADIQIKIMGDKAIIRKLKRIEKESKQRSILNKGLRVGAKITRKAVTRRLKARRDTGAMSKGLKTGSKRGRAMIVIKSPTREKLAQNNPNYKENAKGYYPAVQEYGSTRRGISALGAYAGGFQETKTAAERAARIKIWNEIKKELGTR